MKNYLLILLSIMVSCTQRDSNHTDESAGDYLIAYNVFVPDSLHPDNYDIFVMEMDGSGKKNITNHPDVAWTYMASGHTIFFISDRDTLYRFYRLYEMNTDGSNINQISDIRLRDSWMSARKNGSELIVSPHPSVDSLLYLIDRSGTVLSKIKTGTPYATDPAFSPDGDKIAFIGSNKKSKRETGYKADIYAINIDGSGLMQLSHYPESDTTAEWYAYKAGPPRWHPSGEFVTYQSKQNGKYSLYAASTNGTRQWKLTENSYNEGWHDWSPDGKWLAIELFDTEQTQFHIGLMNWDTKELNILTDTTYKYQQAPVFVKKG